MEARLGKKEQEAGRVDHKLVVRLPAGRIHHRGHREHRERAVVAALGGTAWITGFAVGDIWGQYKSVEAHCEVEQSGYCGN